MYPLKIKNYAVTPQVTIFVVWSSCLLSAYVAYVANNMDPDQTAPKGAVWSGFILFAFIKKSSLKCTWKYAAGNISIEKETTKMYG